MDDARRLRDAVRRLIVEHGAFDEARRPRGTPMSTPHAWALLELLQHDQPLTVSELAERLNIDRTNVSRLCARMEADGELLRERDPQDARIRRLRLTPSGADLARSVDEASARHFARLSDALAADDTRVVEALDRLREAIAATRDEDAR